MTHFVVVRIRTTAQESSAALIVGPFKCRSTAGQWAAPIAHIASPDQPYRFETEVARDFTTALRAAPDAETLCPGDHVQIGRHLYERSFLSV
jgi:hypothetical protein